MLIEDLVSEALPGQCQENNWSLVWLERGKCRNFREREMEDCPSLYMVDNLEGGIPDVLKIVATQ